MPNHLGFRIVITIEKNVIGCFEIGDNKNELTKMRFKSLGDIIINS